MSTQIDTDIATIQDDLDRLDTEVRFLEVVSKGFLHAHSTVYYPNYLVAPLNGARSDRYDSVADRLSKTQSAILFIQEKANLIVGVLGAYILPILFGTIGAVAYVIRTISDQIRTSTFSTTSPVRHVMRTTLGAMAGLVVGLFSDLSTKLSLSPLAVAFLAGYGVEALFSMFDSIIEKFKTTKIPG